MAARRRAIAAFAALALAASPRAAHAAFSTTLHGAPTETIEPGTPGAATLELQPWLTTVDPDAVCNDGSPGGYYFKKGSDPSLWLMYLEGGYWCWDEPSCSERYSTLKFDMSSSGWKQLFAQEGIFGTDPGTNPWANANMVFVKYCTSDSWFGDAPASSNTWGFAFRGSRLVSATVAAMMQYNGLGASGGQERLLFGGCSAGGRGVLTNLDAVAAAAPSNVHVQGLLDAAAWVDVQPIIPDMLTLQQMTQDLYGFTSPPIPAECAAQYSGGDEWRCLWPSYRLPFIKTNFFLNAAQFDAFQIMYDTNNLDSTYCCETQPQQQWVEQFQTTTLQLIQQLPQGSAVYSSTCLVHCLSCNSDFWTFTVDGMSLAQAMQQWYFADQPVQQVSNCNGWDCTLQCSGGPWEPTNQQCMTSTNVCANTYMNVPPSASGSSSSGGSSGGGGNGGSTGGGSAQTAAGMAAWNAAQAAKRASASNPATSDWSATSAKTTAAPYNNYAPNSYAATSMTVTPAPQAATQAQAQAVPQAAPQAVAQAAPQAQAPQGSALAPQVVAQEQAFAAANAQEAAAVAQSQAQAAAAQAALVQAQAALAAAEAPQAGNAVGTVGATEPALSPQQQQALQAQVTLQQQQATLAAQQVAEQEQQAAVQEQMQQQWIAAQQRR